MTNQNETQQPQSQTKSVAERTLEALTSLNASLEDIKALAQGVKAAPAAKGKASKATDAEWAQRIERNKAAGRFMDTARFYCAGTDCTYHCYNEAKIDAHVVKRGGDHAKKDV